MKLFNFSRVAIIKLFLREHFSFLFTQYDYCCKVFYTSILYRGFNMEACVFRQLEVLENVSSTETLFSIFFDHTPRTLGGANSCSIIATY